MARVADLFLQRLFFEPRSVNVGFVVDDVALGHDFLQVLQFSLLSIIPPSHLNTSLIRTSDGVPEISKRG
jgi:hypothetical protein